MFEVRERRTTKRVKERRPITEHCLRQRDTLLGMGVTDRRLLHSETLGVAGRSVPQGPDPCPHEIDHCRWNAERTWDKARHPSPHKRARENQQDAVRNTPPNTSSATGWADHTRTNHDLPRPEQSLTTVPTSSATPCMGHPSTSVAAITLGTLPDSQPPVVYPSDDSWQINMVNVVGP